MPDGPTLAVQTKKPNQGLDMCDILRDPIIFNEYIRNHVFIDASIIRDAAPLIRSIATPSPDNIDKVWIKIGAPYGVGIFTDGNWQIIYGVPRRLPTVWEGNGLGQDADNPRPPSGWRLMTQQELDDAGFTNQPPDPVNNIAFGHVYIKFDPPTV